VIAPFVSTHAAKIFASVLISACGTVPFPAGVVVSAAPVDRLTRFAAFANAFAIPTLASAVPELDTCVASVANPANAYAAATVDTSFTVTVIAGLPLAGQLPIAAIKPAAAFVPDPVFPPNA
jgi:hypothetical protein